MAKGILIAAMDFSACPEDEFHDWYDLEHVPERLRIPGFLNAERADNEATDLADRRAETLGVAASFHQLVSEIVRSLRRLVIEAILEEYIVCRRVGHSAFVFWRTAAATLVRLDDQLSERRVCVVAIDEGKLEIRIERVGVAVPG